MTLSEFVSIGGADWSMARCERCGIEIIGGGWGTRLLAFVFPRWFGCRSILVPPPPWPKPTEADAERAKQVARERGWLRPDGTWVWDD